MNSDINLIKKESGVILAERIKPLRMFAITIASLVVLLSVTFFIITRQESLGSIKAEQNSLFQNISFLKDKAAKLNFLNDRVRNIESIIRVRKNYINTVSIILDGMPSDVLSTSLTLDKENILLTVYSSSLSSVNKFLNNTIEVTQEKHLLRDLIIESLTAQNRQYLLTLKAKLL